MQRLQRGLTREGRSELWRRWKCGQSISEIGRALCKPPGSVFTLLASNGGIVPRTRKRNSRHLSLTEREDISRGLAAGATIRGIAARLGRNPSTISREISRNGGITRYRAFHADSHAWQKAKRPQCCKLASNGRLRRIVAARLQDDWSPEQVSGWLRQKFSKDDSMQISHETIYRSLFIQARGVLRQELIKHLRSRRTMRRSRHSTTAGQTRGQIIDAVSIRERPADVEDRAVPGHWEGDLISGANNTHIATLVERQTRYTMLVKVKGKDADNVVSAVAREVRKLPKKLRRSLTWDRGTEMAKHKEFSVATNVTVYFCDPQSPWQRGTNENTNRLLRQYFPKGTELSHFSQSELNRVASRLNCRPRKTLGFHSPNERYFKLLP